MNTEIKQQWVDALRSGKYKKGTGRLRKNRAYCCLGVLCDIMGCRWQEEDKGRFDCYNGMECEDVVLPKGFSEKAQLDRSGQLRLAKLNDGGWSFAEIADLIEKEY